MKAKYYVNQRMLKRLGACGHENVLFCGKHAGKDIPITAATLRMSVTVFAGSDDDDRDWGAYRTVWPLYQMTRRSSKPHEVYDVATEAKLALRAGDYRTALKHYNHAIDLYHGHA